MSGNRSRQRRYDARWREGLYPAAGEGIFQVQRIDPAHEGQIGGRDSAGQMVDAAPVDAKRTIPGSMGALIVSYYGTSDYKQGCPPHSLVSRSHNPSRTTLGINEAGASKLRINVAADKAHKAAQATLRALPIDAVETEHVLAVIAPIWKEKPETASRLRGRIEAVLAAPAPQPMATSSCEGS